MQRVGGTTEESRSLSACCAVCLLTSLLVEDVHRDRDAEGESSRRRFPPFDIEAWLRLWQLKVVTSCGGNVIEVEELRQRNRRELLLLEEEQGFSAEASFVVFVVTELAPHN